MTITVNKEEGEVTDAVVNGSSVDVTGAYTYTCCCLLYTSGYGIIPVSQISE